jgi:very-short-patch-repair endonuclease
MPRPKAAPRRAELKRGFAKHLRENPTDAERRLWRSLRVKQLGDLRLRRQQPIGPYIVDFYCSAAKLIVELDGDQHGIDKNIAYDADRTLWLEERGYKVLRFSNVEVLKGNVTDVIWHEAESRLPLPEWPSAVRPSLKGRVE